MIQAVLQFPLTGIPAPTLNPAELPPSLSPKDAYLLEMKDRLGSVWQETGNTRLSFPEWQEEAHKCYAMWDQMSALTSEDLSRTTHFIKTLSRFLLSERYYFGGEAEASFPLHVAVCAHGPFDTWALKILAEEAGIALVSREDAEAQRLLCKMSPPIARLVRAGRVQLSPITEPYPHPFDLAIWIQPTMRQEGGVVGGHPQISGSGDRDGYLTPEMLVENLVNGGTLLIQTTAPQQFVAPFLNREGMQCIWRTTEIGLANYLFPSQQLWRGGGEVALFRVSGGSLTGGRDSTKSPLPC